MSCKYSLADLLASVQNAETITSENALILPRKRKMEADECEQNTHHSYVRFRVSRYCEIIIKNETFKP